MEVLPSNRECFDKPFTNAKRNFCDNSINILRAHRDENIIEVERIDLSNIECVKLGIEQTFSLLNQTPNPDSLFEVLTKIALPPCRALLEQSGLAVPVLNIQSIQAALTFIRKIVLLLDNATVSYVRSHGFNESHFGSDIEGLDVSSGDDALAFKCFWSRLACLDLFLDNRKVWVFVLYNKELHRIPTVQDLQAIPKAVLTRMEDLADAWGPVYGVPSTSGRVKYYAVSKGVIYPVRATSISNTKAVVECHYTSELSFFIKSKGANLSIGKDLSLARDDWLLIGAGLQENSQCNYKISDFWAEFGLQLPVLGTHESVWRTDSRVLTLSLSKYVGVTISGSQKLIPQTTVKQHTLDKWTTNPSRSNPGILNQYDDVELSHCTGNARRISIRKLYDLYPHLAESRASSS